MIKYLIVLLADSSVSFCHYQNRNEANLIPIETLREAILFAMKYDMRIQYVLPDFDLPHDYMEAIASMFHDNIGRLGQEEMSDVIVIDGIKELSDNIDKLDAGIRYLVRTGLREFFTDYKTIIAVLEKNISVNLVYTDIEIFSEKDIDTYSDRLKEISKSVKDVILRGGNANTNILTDRIALDAMNNCGAGDTSITLAPDGKFYPCPAFYYDNDGNYAIGSVQEGVDVRNQKLYTLSGAPLCKRCDAYQCKRCVWLNKKLTYEVNVPSRQQCVLAHVERNASRDLLEALHANNLLRQKEMEAIDYLDPFDDFQRL